MDKVDDIEIVKKKKPFKQKKLKEFLEELKLQKQLDLTRT